MCKRYKVPDIRKIRFTISPTLQISTRDKRLTSVTYGPLITLRSARIRPLYHEVKVKKRKKKVKKKVLLISQINSQGEDDLA